MLAGAFLLVRSIAFAEVPKGFKSLFNGKDFSGWKIPEGDGGHWKVLNGVIDYDARSESPKDKNLWSEKSYKDFVMRIDWRIKETTGLYPVPSVLQMALTRRTRWQYITPTPAPDSGIFCARVKRN